MQIRLHFGTISIPGNAQVSDSRHSSGSAKLEIIPEEGSECQTFFGGSFYGGWGTRELAQRTPPFGVLPVQTASILWPKT
jgi:hypothetical protein